MSVLLALMIVLKSVTTPTPYITVAVMLATHLIQRMVKHAMVWILHCAIWQKVYYFSQMSMNVHSTFLDVHSPAVTLWVTILVAVMMDTHWPQMEKHAMVGQQYYTIIE